MLSQPLAPDLSLGALCLMPLCEAASINSLQKTSASVAFCAEKAHEQPLGAWASRPRSAAKYFFEKKFPMPKFMPKYMPKERSRSVTVTRN